MLVIAISGTAHGFSPEIASTVLELFAVEGGTLVAPRKIPGLDISIMHDLLLLCALRQLVSAFVGCDGPATKATPRIQCAARYESTV
jgi:hypothetical protein